MFLKKIIFIISLIIFVLFIRAQSVSYQIEPDVENLLNKHYSAWQKIKTVSGYRIQIMSISGTNSRVRAEIAKKDFKAAFPKIPCYLSYSEPNFRLRIGNFKSYLEALYYLNMIDSSFPGSFIVKDGIYFSSF